MLPPNMIHQAAQSALNQIKPSDEDESQEGEAEQFEDPRNQDEDGTCLYLDKDMFGSKIAKGDEVMIKGTVKSLGSKIGVIPDEIVKGHEEQDSEEEHGDEEEGKGDEKPEEFQKY